ncbi:hypothetical protein KEM48_005531 [Puccinia striiformis f. sp. tritici PST-130]|nr:hypothetical protein KEM48_005531 [Puccinia striiformis f. sp. tritici PST-130]
MSIYPSQFALAAAAVDYLQDENKWIQCINALLTIVLHGLDAAGGAGELASRVMLCAMRKAMLKSGEADLLTGRPVCLVNFLEALTGKKEDDLQLGLISTENRDDLLENGMIIWNHFSLIKYSPTSKELLQFMHRGKKTQQGPQLRRRKSQVDQCLHQGTRSDTGVATTQDLRRASLSFNGIDQFGCLTSQELRDVLQTLIDLEPDFVALQSDEPGKQYSKLINPHLQNK